MALDDVGANPARLAAAIHDQLNRPSGAVRVDKIAGALDIVDIRIKSLSNIEAALITGPERDEGAVVLNINSSRERRRFSLAHELGHFLNPWHVPTATYGFECSRSDMAAAIVADQDRHKRQEGEANVFAIELLAPRYLCKRFVEDVPDMKAVLAMADELEISREAAVRRYIDLHDESLAVAFAKEGHLVYVGRGSDFPPIVLKKGDGLPRFKRQPPGSLSSADEHTPEDWLRGNATGGLSVQTLYQQNGHSITLLRTTSAPDDDDCGIDDAYDRFTRR